MEMSFSTLTSDAINATFSSIKDAADVKSVDLLAGSALSSSAFGWVRADVHLVATIDASNLLPEAHLDSATFLAWLASKRSSVC